MPTFNPDLNVSSRVATLIGEYAARNQTGEENPLSGRDWFTMKVKELAREFARTEYRRQKEEGPQDPVPEEINSEVT